MILEKLKYYVQPIRIILLFLVSFNVKMKNNISVLVNT